MSSSFAESDVEEAALAWLESAGWTIRHGADMVPGELFGERDDYGQVVLAGRLREALVRLNPDLPQEALDDALHRLICGPRAQYCLLSTPRRLSAVLVC